MLLFAGNTDNIENMNTNIIIGVTIGAVALIIVIILSVIPLVYIVRRKASSGTEEIELDNTGYVIELHVD